MNRLALAVIAVLIVVGVAVAGILETEAVSTPTKTFTCPPICGSTVSNVGGFGPPVQTTSSSNSLGNADLSLKRVWRRRDFVEYRGRDRHGDDHPHDPSIAGYDELRHSDHRLYLHAGHYDRNHYDHSRASAPGLHDHGDCDLDQLRPNRHRDQLHVQRAA